ncbi:DUF4097 family beta strand repeat-containing protein [Halapricum hydrolyticum]|uniref:DUF4097 domain-containing protein n=1 Tax=Halapricum hydrolyticum TaxID=2979991 RepID=A0AAE3I9I7_9EURY|nr:DUF4097 family beta strand repeat-containing protein [Halapricum hydrolyticum]MCU4719654.1 DUF4097 domain-containing protein [Halapricum hydrolyticum]MCU4725952.1 DUF4097 domain-containing protein [Halapricum hydrolyticum]
METFQRRTFLIGCVTVASGAAGCVWPGTLTSARTSEELDVPSGTAVVVENRNGDVLVEGGQTAILEIEKSTRYGSELLEKVNVEASADGDRFRIETIDRTPPNQSVSVDVTLSVPDGVSVERVETTNGDVTARDVSGDATLRGTNGDVLADGVEGYVTVRSGNGDVRTRGVTGLDGARTRNGDVDVEVPAIRGDATAESTNGDVSVAIAPGIDAVVDLRTVNGTVGYSGLDLELSVDRPARLRGTLGDGGNELAAASTNGDVRLRAL